MHQYKAGDKVRVIDDSDDFWMHFFNTNTEEQMLLKKGDILELVNDFDTDSPIYTFDINVTLYPYPLMPKYCLCFSCPFGVITNKLGQKYFRIDAKYVELVKTQKKCDCDIMILMTRGCQCGGS